MTALELVRQEELDYDKEKYPEMLLEAAECPPHWALTYYQANSAFTENPAPMNGRTLFFATSCSIGLGINIR